MTATMPTVHEFATTGPIDVDLRVHSGDVTVIAVDSPAAVVTIQPSNGSDGARAAAAETRVSFDDGRLRVETPRKGWLGSLRGAVLVSVSVPLDSTVSASLGSADLRAKGRLGSTTIDTGSGDVSISESSADVTAETGSGDLRLGLIAGAVRLQSGSGDVDAQEIGGDVDVKAASGDVTIGTARGAVRVRTASGDIRIDAARGNDVSIDAASGDVSIGVPAGTSTWLDLASMSGSTRSDLRPTGEPQGGPALSLRIHTMSGDINVHRTAA
jgi:hypothetical protein